MPHFHLSAQAGDDMILKRMKRRHSRAEIITIAHRLRELRSDIALGADIITGFPTEDEAMFTRSLDLVDEAGLTHLHVFPFSPRPGTPAALMPQVAGDIIKERSARLRAKGEAAMAALLTSRIGQNVSVLIEQDRDGHCQHYLPVRLNTDVEAGTIRTARVLAVEGTTLIAEDIT